MATTGFWPIRGRLKAAIDYAENPDKTTHRKYLDDDLAAALQYASNGDKTDRRMYVGGINCSRLCACEQMMAVKRRFGERGKNIAYHGYQSFAAGEVTPQEAFAIGMETARRMWGDRYQVVVTTHLNTDHIHNHFVVNSVSFRDGHKFRDQIGDHLELRRISDEICRSRGLSVPEGSSFHGGTGNEYWLSRSGKKSSADSLREDVEYCLNYASTWDEFTRQLRGLGYEIDETRLSVKAQGWQRAKRLASIGFTKEVIRERLTRNRADHRFYTLKWNTHLPYKPKKFPLESELRRLAFSLEHSYDPATVAVDTLLLLFLSVIALAQRLADVILLSPDLRHAARDVEEYVKDYRFITQNGIHTVNDLTANIEQCKAQLSVLEAERRQVCNRIRRPKSPEELAENKARRKEISQRMEPIRERLRQAEGILEESPRLYDLLRREHTLEQKALNKYKER